MDAYGNSAGEHQCKGQLKQPIMACGYGAGTEAVTALEPGTEQPEQCCGPLR